MPIYKGTTELTKIADFLTATEHDITEVYFGDKQVFTVWGEYDGTLPATYSANGSTLADYRVYGTNGGVGDRTENLWNNDDFWDNGHRFKKNEILFGYAYTVLPGNYTISTNVINNVDPSIASVFAVAAKPDNDPSITSSSNGVFVNRPRTVTVSENQALWIIIRVANGDSQGYLIWNRETFSHYWIMLTEGSTAPAEYVPYGYEVPMSVSDGTTSTTILIYIGDTPLGEDEYVSFKEQKIYRMSGGVLTPTDPPVLLPALPTVDGTNIVDYAGQSAAVPSRFWAKYRKEGY